MVPIYGTIVNLNAYNALPTGGRVADVRAL